MSHIWDVTSLRFVSLHLSSVISHDQFRFARVPGAAAPDTLPVPDVIVSSTFHSFSLNHTSILVSCSPSRPACDCWRRASPCLCSPCSSFYPERKAWRLGWHVLIPAPSRSPGETLFQCCSRVPPTIVLLPSCCRPPARISIPLLRHLHAYGHKVHLVLPMFVSDVAMSSSQVCAASLVPKKLF